MIRDSVLITGIAGFIGFHLASRMIKEGVTVIGFDNLNSYYDPNLKIARLNELGLDTNQFGEHELKVSTNGHIYFFKGNLEDNKSWELIEENFNVVSIIHLAAQAGVRYSLEQPRKYISSNILGFLNVLEFCRKIGLKKLIYASSSSVYGMNSKQPFSESEVCDSPVSLYAATKRSNELMASTYNHLYGLESIGLRFFTVYGPWGRPDMAPFLFTKAAIEGKPIQVFNNGNQRRDFTYIDDIVNGVLQIWRQPEKIEMAEICNIGNGAPVGLMDFIEAIEVATGESLEKDFKPAQAGDVEETFADIQKLQSIFNYKPQISLNIGVPAFVTWYKEYLNINSGVDE